MDIKTSTSRILMSDELFGRLSDELTNNAAVCEPERTSERFVMAAITLNDVDDPVVGVLVGIEATKASLTTTVQLQVEQAFAVLNAGVLRVSGVVIELGEQIVKPVVGCCDALSIDSIGSTKQLCILSLRFALHT